MTARIWHRSGGCASLPQDSLLHRLQEDAPPQGPCPFLMLRKAWTARVRRPLLHGSAAAARTTAPSLQQRLSPPSLPWPMPASWHWPRNAALHRALQCHFWRGRLQPRMLHEQGSNQLARKNSNCSLQAWARGCRTASPHGVEQSHRVRVGRSKNTTLAARTATSQNKMQLWDLSPRTLR